MLPRFVAAFFMVALAQMPGQVDQLAPGTFLVASRDLGDPNFARTVVLLVHYDDENGAMGLIINRQTDVPLSRVFAELKEAKDRADPIYVGGPVETGTVMALLKSANKPKDAELVFGDVYLITSKALLQKTLAAGAETSRFHAYLGYAGWGREQLGHEVELGAWHVLPADTGDVFHSDPDSVWLRLIRRTEVRIACLSTCFLPNPAVPSDLAAIRHKQNAGESRDFSERTPLADNLVAIHSGTNRTGAIRDPENTQSGRRRPAVSF